MITRTNGQIAWDKKDFVHYVITGEDRDGRRFRRVYKDWFPALCHNIWRGNKWGVTYQGRRVLLQTVDNY